jgi:hypothetical protein
MALFKGQQLGVTLMVIMLFGWITVTLGTQFLQASNHGFGSGFGDGRQLDPSLQHRQGVSDNPAAVAAVKANDRDAFIDATNDFDNGGGLWHDAWRLLLTLGVCITMIFFWYFMMSRTGSF